MTGGHVIRCHADSEDAYKALDVVVDKLERQLRKHKTKFYNRIHTGKGVKEYGFAEDFDFSSVKVPEDLINEVKNYQKPNIIKTKRFEMEPIDPETAIDRLENCGHPFYMFLDVYTNKIAVVYKRDDGDFGVIEPEHLTVDN